MRLKREKCLFMLPEVDYLGHRMSKEGIKPTKKVSAITHAHRPNNVFELRSFLIFTVNSYQTILLFWVPYTSYSISWEDGSGGDHNRAFTEAKSLLKSHCLLTHYDCSKYLTLACHASPYGVGAVLSRKLDYGNEKPIAYVYRTLNKTESKYVQIDKESLAIIFGITKFHKYLVGHKFAIYMDHKPLTYLFSENKGIPMNGICQSNQMSFAVKWLWVFSPVQTWKGVGECNADGLSRLPWSDVGQEDTTPTELINLIEHLNSTPISVFEINKCTNIDKPYREWGSW